MEINLKIKKKVKYPCHVIQTFIYNSVISVSSVAIHQTFVPTLTREHTFNFASFPVLPGQTVWHYHVWRGHMDTR